jgi:AcrR family transcriptional regulator
MVRRTRPMARASRREQLLQIARQLVAKEGVSALTMMALSEKANVAKPVVYSHFADRAAVAIALLDDHYESIGRFVRERVGGATTLEDYFSRLVDASFEFESTTDTPVRKITNGFSAGDRINQAFLSHEINFRRHWEQLLEAFGARREKIAVAAHALSAMMDYTVLTYAIAPQQKIARETLKQMLLAALRALLPDQKLELRAVPHFQGWASGTGTAKAPSSAAPKSEKPARKKAAPKKAALKK